MSFRKLASQMIALGLVTTGCFQLLTNIGSVAKAPTYKPGPSETPEGTEAKSVEVTSTELSNTKSVASIASDSTESQKMTVGANNILAGTSVSIAPGTLNIPASIIIEQGADLGDTTLLQEVTLANNTTVTGSGSGVIVRPSVDTVLQKPLQISLPLPLVLV